MAIAAIRYNNPGNVSLPIKGWTGGGQIVGITGQSGYASFPDMATGYAAFKHRVNDYIDGKGLTTIRQLNTRYAEHGGWGAGVSAASGIGIDTALDTSNPSQMNSLYNGIIKQETGKTPSALGIGNANGPHVDGGFSSPEYPGIDFNAVPPGTNGTFTTDQLKAMDLDGNGETTMFETKEYRRIQSEMPQGGNGPAGGKGGNPWDANSVVKEQSAPQSKNMTQATDAQTVQQAITGGQQANATVQAAAQVAATQAATTKAALGSVEGWLGQTQSWAGGWLVRGMIVLLGLLLIGGALGLLIWKGSDALPDVVTG